MHRLAFLTYLNRSGSTFLADALDARREVRVSLEANLPDGIKNRGYRLRRPADAPRLLDLLYDDPKFRSWEVPRKRLERRLAEEDYPVDFARFLLVLLEESIADGDARVLVYKAAGYARKLDRLRRLFPEGMCVFVMRDLRAVYASQKRSPDSRTGRMMAESPVVTARVFRQVSRLLRRHAGTGWLHVVRYEDLIDDPDGELAKVLAFLGCGGDRREGPASYRTRIPESQQHLHRHVGLGPLRSRIDVWRAELEETEIRILEGIAGSEMDAWGYELSGARRGALGRMLRTRAWGEVKYHGGAVKSILLERPWFSEH